MIRALDRMIRRLTTPEIFAFLAVGGIGYVVDVLGFNLLRTVPTLAAMDPAVAKTMAVAAAMVVTYIGNEAVTWRDAVGPTRRRQVTLFVLFNVIGLGFSVVTLMISHDLLRLTSQLADNVSANIVGVALGTAFRYLTYKRYVFVVSSPTEVRLSVPLRR